MKNIAFFSFCIFSLLLFPTAAFSQAPNRFMTVVYPVRSASHWRNPQSLATQVGESKSTGLPVTWLVSYPILNDSLSRAQLDGRLLGDEIGLWLEVDEQLAQDSFVPYLFGIGDWARADKVLLSGYSPDERVRMIDTLFGSFKKAYGVYPSSVGAWYIDPYSLYYMSRKYSVGSAIIVADQYQTDTYGVWGQPWGSLYVPSRFHTLIPDASENGMPVVFQWAVRDPVRGFGKTVDDSTWSVQANDYAGHGMDITYFQRLLLSYLFSYNDFSQLTIGIEVGQEGESFRKEYAAQVAVAAAIANSPKARQLTMRETAAEYKKNRGIADSGYFVKGDNAKDSSRSAYWFSTPFYRIGLLKDNDTLRIRDLRAYSSRISPDVFRKDTSAGLRRIVPSVVDEVLDGNQRILAKGITGIVITRDTQGVHIAVHDSDGEHELVLGPRDAVWQGKSLLGPPAFVHPLARRLRDAVLADHAGSFHGWRGDFRFARIDGVPYGGFWVSPDRLLGVRASWPPAGVFSFPFQTLARFRSILPQTIKSVLADYLVNAPKLSTITE